MRSSFSAYNRLIITNEQFETEYREKIRHLLSNEPVNRGPAHAMKDDTTSSTHELMYVTETINIPSVARDEVQSLFKPNLPWAEDHFQERVGGEPLNPSPSEAWWPYARQGNAEHKKDQIFSHTYPERFWPQYAGMSEEDRGLMGAAAYSPRRGIRFQYGSLDEVIEILAQNPMSRQAYLPIWFPEDLTAAAQGERVPCSMGYHFIMNEGKLDCVYTMRSCDIVRFYRDDLYMAARLLQWVTIKVGNVLAIQGAGSAADIRPGKLVVHIDNLHCFPGDKPFLESLFLHDINPDHKGNRKNFNFGAMF